MPQLGLNRALDRLQEARDVLISIRNLNNFNEDADSYEPPCC